ncbi:hypothetical protein EI94DRAFT_173573 [Lactarius quietus]|nr:hypothetical protein EI94DRAFT_173573 [Lactarius quietus]
MDDFLSVFQSMTRLETLVLVNTLPELPETVRTLSTCQDIVPVRLEHLRYLSLSGFVLDCANLMRNFIMPRCRKVNLETEARWPLREVALAVSPLSSIISSIFNESDEQEVRYVGTLQLISDNEIVIEFHASYSTPNPAYYLYVSLTWQPTHRDTIVDTSPGFERLLLALPLSQITRFYSTLRKDYIDRTEWLRVIPRLFHVKKVHLTGGYIYGFVRAFHEAHASLLPPSNGLDTAVLPDLDLLTIGNAHFSFPLGDNQLFTSLTRSLTRRQQLQLRVPNIEIMHCHVTPAQLAALNQLTPEFVKYTGQPVTWGVGELDDESSGEADSGDGDED